MALQTVRIVMDDAEVIKFLKSADVVDALKSVAKEIKAETEQDYSGPEQGYKYDIDEVNLQSRAGVTISTTNPRAPYSEAKHGHLQTNLLKNRGQI